MTEQPSADGQGAPRSRPPSRRGALQDPIELLAHYDITTSKAAIAGHPIHAMLVAFPIALTVCTLGADALYLWTGDIFWTRTALWGSGVGFLVGLLAGLVGTLELLLVPGIRLRAASWTHFVIAMALLSILGLNWGYRLQVGAEEAVLPIGILISILATAMTALTGWHGGKLVFDHQIGITKSSE